MKKYRATQGIQDPPENRVLESCHSTYEIMTYSRDLLLACQWVRVGHSGTKWEFRQHFVLVLCLLKYARFLVKKSKLFAFPLSTGSCKNAIKKPMKSKFIRFLKK